MNNFKGQLDKAERSEILAALISNFFKGQKDNDSIFVIPVPLIQTSSSLPWQMESIFEISHLNKSILQIGLLLKDSKDLSLMKV